MGKWHPSSLHGLDERVSELEEQVPRAVELDERVGEMRERLASIETDVRWIRSELEGIKRGAATKSSFLELRGPGFSAVSRNSAPLLLVALALIAGIVTILWR